jgi:hypothetical protein
MLTSLVPALIDVALGGTARRWVIGAGVVAVEVAVPLLLRQLLGETPPPARRVAGPVTVSTRRSARRQAQPPRRARSSHLATTLRPLRNRKRALS